jgi:hypothetical protein
MKRRKNSFPLRNLKQQDPPSTAVLNKRSQKKLYLKKANGKIRLRPRKKRITLYQTLSFK